MADINRPNRLDRMTIENRRTIAIRMYLRGRTMDQIAVEFNCSRATISLDLKAVRAEWRAERLRLMEEQNAPSD